MNKVVLIVEDEEDVATYLATILQENGFTPVKAADAQTGLTLASDDPPDLICLDIMMPAESGMSLYRKLKKNMRLKNIPVVVVSGVGREIENEFVAASEDISLRPPEAFFEKPVDIQRFIETLNNLVTPAGKGSHGRKR